MTKETIHCNGCGAELAPENVTVLFKPLRGGLDIILSRSFASGPAAGLAKANKRMEFCGPDCVAKMLADAIAKIEEPKNK